MNMGNKTKIGYRYLDIDLVQFATFDENYDAQCEDIQIDNEIRFNYQHTDHLVISEISVTYLQHEKPVMKALMKSVFSLSVDSIKSLVVDNVLILNIPILIQFASLNYGALRGALSQKTLGMSLHNYILPPIYFDNIIKSPFKIKIDPIGK